MKSCVSFITVSLLVGFVCLALSQEDFRSSKQMFVGLSQSLGSTTNQMTKAERKLRLLAIHYAGEEGRLKPGELVIGGDGKNSPFDEMLALRLMFEKGDDYHGRILLERATKAHPDNPVILRLAAQFELRKETPNKDKARGLLKRSIEQDPHYSQAYYDLACLTSNYEERVEYCYRILVLEPRGSVLASNTVDVLLSRKKNEPK